MTRAGSKIKMFLFLAFAVVTLALAANVFDMTRNGVNAIKQGNEEFKCVDFNYVIKDIRYDDGRLIFDLQSKEYDTAIERVKIVSDVGEEHVEEIKILGGESKYIDSKLSLNKSFRIYFNNCENGFNEYV